MKIKKEVYLRKIIDDYILVPIGKTVDEYNGLFNLSETGAVLVNAILDGKEEDELVKALTDEFEIDCETAEKDTKAFLEMLREFDLI